MRSCSEVTYYYWPRHVPNGPWSRSDMIYQYLFKVQLSSRHYCWTTLCCTPIPTGGERRNKLKEVGHRVGLPDTYLVAALQVYICRTMALEYVRWAKTILWRCLIRKIASAAIQMRQTVVIRKQSLSHIGPGECFRTSICCSYCSRLAGQFRAKMSPQEYVRQPQDARNGNQEHDGVIARCLTCVLFDVEHVLLFLRPFPRSHLGFPHFLTTVGGSKRGIAVGCRKVETYGTHVMDTIFKPSILQHMCPSWHPRFASLRWSGKRGGRNNRSEKRNAGLRRRDTNYRTRHCPRSKGKSRRRRRRRRQQQ